MHIHIEHWTYPAGLNHTEMQAYQASILDEYGATITSGPVRSTRDDAQRDGRELLADLRAANQYSHQREARP